MPDETFTKKTVISVVHCQKESILNWLVGMTSHMQYTTNKKCTKNSMWHEQTVTE